MISFIGRVKNLKYLTEPLMKSEALGPHIQTMFRRTLFTKNILLSGSINKEEFYEQDLQIPDNQTNLGKIIELDDDFNELRLEGIKRRKRRKQNKLLKKGVNINTKNNKKIIDGEGQEQKNTYLNAKSKDHVLKKNAAEFSSLMVDLKLKKKGHKDQNILLEGKRLIKDAISAGCMPKKIFYSREEELEKLQLPQGIKVYRLPYKNLNFWCDVVTSQGIIGIFDIPKSVAFKNNDQTLPLTIICDNVRDPGNIGSMLRVIAAAGCEKIILTKGCVDIWDPKVLRVGCGAHFRIPIIKDLLWSDIENEISENAKVFLADSNASYSENKLKENNLSGNKNSELSDNLPIHCYYSLNYGEESTVIIIGGETYGVSDEAFKFTLSRKGSKIFIPMSNQVESLNNSMALGILTYEFRRQFDCMNKT